MGSSMQFILSVKLPVWFLHISNEAERNQCYTTHFPLKRVNFSHVLEHVKLILKALLSYSALSVYINHLNLNRQVDMISSR